MSSAALAIVQTLKGEQQDFEWYPTTDAIIARIKRDITTSLHDYTKSDDSFSLLDCGAGDGRVLLALTKGGKYAIEKAEPHLRGMPKDIYIVGTDFHEQSLIDKQVDVVFCNPPYSEFQAWAAKVIREANAKLIYLVIPNRWESSIEIQEALKARSCQADVLDTFDFESGDRQARAVVNVLRIRLVKGRYNHKPDTDPFDVWFESAFLLDIPKVGDAELSSLNADSDQIKQAASNELVVGSDYVQALQNLYDKDMAHLFDQYRKFEQLDASLLKEVGVTAQTVKGSLKMRITGLKNVYWKTFFDSFAKITSKLTTAKRKSMLEKIMRHVNVDFTASNAYAMAIWVVKNSNTYFSDQLVEVFERFLDKANVQNYKSNKVVYGEKEWRWNSAPEGMTRYKLDYRVVLDRAGGIVTSSMWSMNQYKGLSERGVEYINDMRTIADNLGFKVDQYDHEEISRGPEWESGKPHIFHAQYKGKEVILMEVKAFKNGNFHIKFNQAFMFRFNVEFGRLKGWLKSAHQAAEEVATTEAEKVMAVEAFNSSFMITGSTMTLLGYEAAA